MTLTVLFKTHLKDMLLIGQMLSRHLTWRKDVQTRLGPAPVSKRLTVGLDIIDVILTHMWTCNFSS